MDVRFSNLHRWALLVALLLPVDAVSAQLDSPSARLWTAATPGVIITPSEGGAFGRSVAVGDFDCNGLDDLAIGIPYQDFFVGDDSGAVTVLYSVEKRGPGTAGQSIFRQNNVTSDGIQPDDRFGLVLAAGDFDSDDCADLAIGAPYEELEVGGFGQVDTGAVFVIYGGPTGLGGYGSDFWHQIALGVSAADDDHFGSALAAGDFDDDGWGDLAIGEPGRIFDGEADAGRITILFGSASGLGGDSRVLYDQVPAQAGQFGVALAAGNFLPAPGDELAVGAPRWDLPGISNAGAVTLLSNLSAEFVSRTRWHEDSAGVPGTAEAGDGFGSVLASGDFDGDGMDELAVGTPWEVPDDGATLKGGLALGAGAVTILDFEQEQHQYWTQDQLAPEASEFADDFGRALAAEDLDGDGIEDLVVGAPGEDLHGAEDSGVVHVIYGSAVQGLTADANQILNQPADTPEFDDQFGFSLAAGHFDGAGNADLAIGTPVESLGDGTLGGAVTVVYSNVLIFLDGFEGGDTNAWSSTTP